MMNNIIILETDNNIFLFTEEKDNVLSSYFTEKGRLPQQLLYHVTWIVEINTKPPVLTLVPANTVDAPPPPPIRSL